MYSLNNIVNDIVNCNLCAFVNTKANDLRFKSYNIHRHSNIS